MAALREKLGLDPERFTIRAMVGAEGSSWALSGLAALARPHAADEIAAAMLERLERG